MHKRSQENAIEGENVFLKMQFFSYTISLHVCAFVFAIAWMERDKRFFYVLPCIRDITSMFRAVKYGSL